MAKDDDVSTNDCCLSSCFLQTVDFMKLGPALSLDYYFFILYTLTLDIDPCHWLDKTYTQMYTSGELFFLRIPALKGRLWVQQTKVWLFELPSHQEPPSGCCGKTNYFSVHAVVHCGFLAAPLLDMSSEAFCQYCHVSYP